MDFDTQIKLAVYRHFAETGQGPSPEAIAGRVGSEVKSVLDTYSRLRVQRVLALEADGYSIRMAPPFLGVPTQHVVVEGKRYFANCACDALGIPAALHQPGMIYSRCEQSRRQFHLTVYVEGPEPSTWLFSLSCPSGEAFLPVGRTGS